MFLLPDGPSHWLAIGQASHGLLAWQIARHWGARPFLRPAPAAETLAAVLLHDAGWTAFDADPGVDAGGRPRTFDRMPAGQHLAIWERSVAIAGAFSRYTGLLVAEHTLRLAGRKLEEARAAGDGGTAALTGAFAARLEAEIERSRNELAADPRYGQALAGRGHAANGSILAACDALAVLLCAAMPGPFTLTPSVRRGEAVPVTVRREDPRTLRLRPWPLEGRGLTIHAEGRRIEVRPYAAEALRTVLAAAPVERVSFRILPPGAPA